MRKTLLYVAAFVFCSVASAQTKVPASMGSGAPTLPRQQTQKPLQVVMTTIEDKPPILSALVADVPYYYQAKASGPVYVCTSSVMRLSHSTTTHCDVAPSAIQMLATTTDTAPPTVHDEPPTGNSFMGKPYFYNRAGQVVKCVPSFSSKDSSAITLCIVAKS